MNIYYSKSTGGFYDLDFHAYTLPSDAVQVPPATYTALISAQSAGQIIQADASGNPVAVAPPALTLAQAQAQAYSAIDAAAGAARTRYISNTPGQDVTYLYKANDAQAYTSASYPAITATSSPGSWVWAEACAINNTTTPTATQCQAAAQYIIATETQWVVKAQQIEQARRTYKIQVGAATTVSQVESLQTAAITAMNGM